jgi:hypothetical protein
MLCSQNISMILIDLTSGTWDPKWQTQPYDEPAARTHPLPWRRTTHILRQAGTPSCFTGFHELNLPVAIIWIIPDSDTRILVLGSGIVAQPCVEYPVRSLKNVVMVACRTLFIACSFISGLPHTNVISLDMFCSEDLDYANSRPRPNSPASYPAYTG